VTLQSSRPPIVLGISGSIAAYRAADIARGLTKNGETVQVVFSQSASHFVGPATFEAITANPVASDLFSPEQEQSIGHIRCVENAGLFLVAPATAGCIAKLSAGVATDFLQTTYLAYNGPVVIAPAMNPAMWEHPSLKSNIETLRSRDHVFIVEPKYGEMVCGHIGQGKLCDVDWIVKAAEVALVAGVSPSLLEGQQLLITAGPTVEGLDDIRYLSNRSSGKMGYALAMAARLLGAEVTLVSGPTQLSDPPGVSVLRVESAKEMSDAVISALDDCPSAFISVAAVADYSPLLTTTGKLSKSKVGQTMTIELERTQDILQHVSSCSRRPKKVVGFAAEAGTRDELLVAARKKLVKKGCDYIVFNSINRAASVGNPVQSRIVDLPKGVMGGDDTEISILSRASRQVDGDVPTWRGSKVNVATKVLLHIFSEDQK